MVVRSRWPVSIRVLVALWLGTSLKAMQEAMEFSEAGTPTTEALPNNQDLENSQNFDDVVSTELGFLKAIRTEFHAFFDSPEIQVLMQAKSADELHALYPDAYQRTIAFLMFLNDCLESHLSPEEMKGLLKESPGKLEWSGDSTLSERVEQLIIASAELAMKTFAENAKALEELGLERVNALAQELKDVSVRFHTNFFVCLGILGGDLSQPAPDVLDELVRQFSFSARLFRQESKRVLWSQTEGGKRRRQQVKNAIDRSHNQEAHQDSSAHCSSKYQCLQ